MAPPAGEQAELNRWLTLAHSHPADAYRCAIAGSGSGVVALGPAGMSLVAGVAALEIGDYVLAERHLRHSLEDGGGLDDDLRAECHLNVSLVLAKQGRFDEAFDEVVLAEAGLNDRAVLFRGRLHAQVGGLHQLRGADDDALKWYELAAGELAEAGDVDRLAVTTNNRAVVYAHQGELAAAIAALEEAEDLHRSCGDQIGAMRAQHNRACLLARRGAVPAALRLLDEADSFLQGRGIDRSVVLTDQCCVLIDAGLADDAQLVAEAATAALRRNGATTDLAELQVAMGRLSFLVGRFGRAARQLDEAADHFEQLGAQAPASSTRRIASLATALERSQDELAPAIGLLAVSDLPIAVHAAATLFRLGQRDSAAEVVAAVLGRPRRGPATERVLLALATAVSAYAAGDWRRVKAALRAGYSHLESHVVSLGWTSLRAAALRYSMQLGLVGASLALEHGDAEECLRWAERSRMLAASLRPVRAPSPELARLIDQLRLVQSQVATTVDEGVHFDLRRRAVELENRARRVAWKEQPVEPMAALGAVDVGAMHARLAGRTLLSYVDTGVSIAVVVLTPCGELRMVELGSTLALQRAVARVDAVVSDPGRAGTGLAPSHQLRVATEDLDARLGRPGRLAGDHALVVVPAGSLTEVPWPLLPSVEHRPVVIAPSGASWSVPGPILSATALLVAGPGLREAPDEVTSIAPLYVGASVLLGEDATVDAVRSRLPSVHVAHLSAHGKLRRDDPMLSGFELADGQIFLQDLQGLERLPRLVVGAACHLGGGSIANEAQLLGLGCALGGRGCEFLVAATGAVSDHETRHLMIRFHELLSGGAPPDAALASSQAGAIERSHLTAGRFCLFAVP